MPYLRELLNTMEPKQVKQIAIICGILGKTGLINKLVRQSESDNKCSFIEKVLEAKMTAADVRKLMQQKKSYLTSIAKAANIKLKKKDTKKDIIRKIKASTKGARIGAVVGSLLGGSVSIYQLKTSESYVRNNTEGFMLSILAAIPSVQQEVKRYVKDQKLNLNNWQDRRHIAFWAENRFWAYYTPLSNQEKKRLNKNVKDDPDIDEDEFEEMLKTRRFKVLASTPGMIGLFAGTFAGIGALIGGIVDAAKELKQKRKNTFLRNLLKNMKREHVKQIALICGISGSKGLAKKIVWQAEYGDTKCSFIDNILKSQMTKKQLTILMKQKKDYVTAVAEAANVKVNPKDTKKKIIERINQSTKGARIGALVGVILGGVPTIASVMAVKPLTIKDDQQKIELESNDGSIYNMNVLWAQYITANDKELHQKVEQELKQRYSEEDLNTLNEERKEQIMMEMLENQKRQWKKNILPKQQKARIRRRRKEVAGVGTIVTGVLTASFSGVGALVGGILDASKKIKQKRKQQRRQ
jgi:uncharacterized membrane protein